jgi:hypothetical protein
MEERMEAGKKKVTEKSKTTSLVNSSTNDRVTVENVNVPGHTSQLDGRMYFAMRQALLTVLPGKGPGLTQTEIRQAILPHLPQDLFPGGAKAGWWSKAVQLDLEAKKIVVRETTKPLRWHRNIDLIKTL